MARESVNEGCGQEKGKCEWKDVGKTKWKGVTRKVLMGMAKKVRIQGCDSAG